MRVLFLFISFPDITESTNMYTDLVQEFVTVGHEVTVVAPAKALEETKVRREGGAKVLRVKTMNLFGVSPVFKGIANLLLPYKFKNSIHKYLRNDEFNLIILPTPPITLVEVAHALKKKHKAILYLILRDIFPQNAFDLGMIKNKFLFNYFRRREKKLYSISDQIGCMSKGNIRYVIRENPEVDKSKFHLLSNWQKVVKFDDDVNEIRVAYGLEGKFVAVFGGNIGSPQKIENIIDLAKAYRAKNNIVFLIIGRGTEKQRLLQLVRQNNLKNIMVVDFIPHKDYMKLINCADVGLISLSDKFTIPNIPSKTLSYFNARLPVLASVDRFTDFGEILDESNSGLWSVTGDLESYIKNFDTLYYNKELRLKMGENGYNYLLNSLTSGIAYQIILSKVSNKATANL